ASGLTTVGGAVTTLGTAYQSVEYGVAGVFEGNSLLGGALISSDVPDDGNPAMANASILQSFGGPTSLQLRASMRSNEADATTSTAGQAGGVRYGKAPNPPGP